MKTAQALQWNNEHAKQRGTLVHEFLAGDRKWGSLRLVFLGILFTGTFLTALIFKPGLLRFLIAPMCAGILAFLAGVRYIQDIYELERFRQSFRYLFSGFFGIFYPKMSVSGGKKVLKPGESNLLDRIGGPGKVYVQPGNAVLFEGLSASLALHTDGNAFVPRFVTIQPIALEDQYGEIQEISAMTRDGFILKVGPTRYRFRLVADRRAGRRKEPYPYDETAIYHMVYNRTVSEDGVGDWAGGVASEVRRTIAGYINRSTIDKLTAPGIKYGISHPSTDLDLLPLPGLEMKGDDPRGDLQRLLFSAETAGKLRLIGTELVAVDIGSFRVDEKVEQQRLNAWQARWVGDAKLTRSLVEARRMAYMEIGRAEAQAEILISIVHALSDVNLEQSDRQSLRDMILVRTAQLIEAMSQSTPEQDKSQLAVQGKREA